MYHVSILKADFFVIFFLYGRIRQSQSLDLLSVSKATTAPKCGKGWRMGRLLCAAADDM
jgi:hypothetical protein